jgi:hypothetical protein
MQNIAQLDLHVHTHEYIHAFVRMTFSINLHLESEPLG